MKAIILFVAVHFIICGAFITPAWAQEWTLFTEANGLAGNSIWFIQEDVRGYLWFVTEFAGVSRYDGVRFQSFWDLNTPDCLVSDNIYCTLADKEGNIWFGTDRGVSRYDGQSFQTFDIDNGLVGNYINFILEDSEGNLWFGTDRGVSRYDGKSFRNFGEADGLADNTIKFIMEDRNGDLWLGTQKGISRYDGEKFHSLAVSSLDHPIQVLFEDRSGNLWFGTEKGVYVKKARSSTIDGPLIETNVRLILEDQSGYLWFATTNQGLLRYDPKEENSQSYFSGSSILSVAEDSRGDLWFGTDSGIIKFDGKDFQNFSKIHDGALGFVWSIREDSDQNIWFGSDNGVWKHTIQNLHIFTEKDGLADDSVEVVLEDKDGNLWFGTRGNGVSRYDGNRFLNFDVKDGLKDRSILSIHGDSKGNIWVGTSSGASQYDGQRFQPVKGEASLENAVRAILEDEATKDLWFATGDGIVKYDGTSFQPFMIENGFETIMDRAGNLWLGSWTDGLYRYDGKNWRHYLKEDGLGSNQITWIVETHERDVWVGFRDETDQTRGGICRFDGTQFTTFTAEDGLSSESTTVALEDNEGNLWFGTEDKGLMRYVGRPIEGIHRFESMTEADGLISNAVTSIFMDRYWSLWFGTDKGISKYDGENFQSIPLDLSLGAVHTIFEDSKGDMWFITTNDGVIKYVPSAKEIRPRVHITEIEADKIFHYPVQIEIPSTTKRITFAFKGISFRTRPEELRYNFQLGGYDEQWRPSTLETRVHYESLKPGKYQFAVRAIDKDLHKSHPSAVVDIEVFRPWYLTTHFLIVIIVGGISLSGGGGYLIAQLNKQRRTSAQLRERLQKQKEAERIQTSKMKALRQLVAGVAHEINNPIGVISSSNDSIYRTVPRIRTIVDQEFQEKGQKKIELIKMLSLLESTSQASNTASMRVGRIVTSLRNFVGLDEAEWRMADINEGIDTTLSLMELGSSGRIKVTKDYGHIPRIYCCPSSLNQVFMCMFRNSTEAIEGEGEVRVKTFVDGDYIKIVINDTGRGILPENLDRIFDPGFTTKSVGVGVGLGLATCYKIIVDEHMGHIHVSSDLGVGTAFTITLPLSRWEGDASR